MLSPPVSTFCRVGGEREREREGGGRENTPVSKIVVYKRGQLGEKGRRCRVTSAQEFRPAFSHCVCACGVRGRQRRGMLRTHFNARGTNGEDREGQRRQSEGCCGLRCCGNKGCPSPLSALSWSLSGQAHAKHAHRWIPPERYHCPGGEPPERGPQKSRDTLSPSCSVQRRDRDGVVTDGGTSGTPTRFYPVWVWVGWVGKAAAWDIAHPREHPRHKRGRGRRVKRMTIVAIEGVAG